MPKLKTKSSVKKRFSLTGTGKIKRNSANKRHFLMNKSKRMKRQSRFGSIVKACDFKTIMRFING
ncbi:MAG: 50S ribosomal protein L35 [Alphaproteobacteria bacterium]|nr:50S ribosomal protein L35 [Alphaproteobacteria bacterium]NCB49089.1 50S ribosomal protein L35 [Alphaproteobacteria bacterium]